MNKKVLFNSQEELDEFLFNTYGDGAYLMDVREFYDTYSEEADLLVYISSTPVYVNTYNSKDELIDGLNTVITDMMPIDEVIKLGKVVKGICDRDDYTHIDSLGIDEITLLIEGSYTKTIRIDYDTFDTITVMYMYSYSTITDDEIEYIKSKTYKLSDSDVLDNILNECQQLLLIDAYYEQIELLKEGLDDAFIKTIREVGYMDY